MEERIDVCVEESTDARIARLELRIAALERRGRDDGRAWQKIARPAERVDNDEAIALETKLGTYWLSRLGIVSLITGAAFLVITYFGELGAIARVACGYAMAAAVAWAGWRLSRRHRTFGQIVFGGGLAIAYFVTYALHFVPAMRMIESELVGVALVAVAIAAIVVTAHRMQSETVAGIALFLGLHTGMLTDVTALSLVATTLLAAGAGFFLAANRWVIVPLSTVVAVYTTHASLAFDAGSTTSADLRLAFVIVDFALFAIASLRHPEARLVRALAVVNWLGALLLGGAALAARSQMALFVGGIGLALGCGLVALVAARRRAAPAFVAEHVGIAVATLALALPAKLEGWALVAGWLVLALASAGLARRAAEAFAALAGLLLGAAYLASHEARLGTLAVIICVVATFVVERVHATGDRRSTLRLVLVAGVAYGLVDIVALALPSGVRTLACVGAGSLLFGLGFALKAAAYRWAAFVVLGVAALRLVAIELAVFSPDQRIATFVLGGLALLAISYVYSRRSSRSAASERERSDLAARTDA